MASGTMTMMVTEKGFLSSSSSPLSWDPLSSSATCSHSRSCSYVVICSLSRSLSHSHSHSRSHILSHSHSLSLSLSHSHSHGRGPARGSPCHGLSGFGALGRPRERKTGPAHLCCLACLPSSGCVRWNGSFGLLSLSPSALALHLRGNKMRSFGSAALGSGRNGNEIEGWDPSLEIEVPADQRPANELAALKEATLYNWGQLEPTQFIARLGGLWLLFFIFLGAPIASASFEPSKEPLEFFLAGGAGALFAVAIIVLRLYLGWSYVGNRLLSAVVPYEETGWYDGQLWVKPPEVLARDRLLGAYQVTPVMNRLKQTLVGAAALLATATISLFLLLPSHDSINANAFELQNISEEKINERNIQLRKQDLLKLPADVINDDKLAAAAAAAANGRPVYCTDRYYRALAGGQYCRWDDLLK